MGYCLTLLQVVCWEVQCYPKQLPDLLPGIILRKQNGTSIYIPIHLLLLYFYVHLQIRLYIHFSQPGILILIYSGSYLIIPYCHQSIQLL